VRGEKWDIEVRFLEIKNSRYQENRYQGYPTPTSRNLNYTPDFASATPHNPFSTKMQNLTNIFPKTNILNMLENKEIIGFRERVGRFIAEIPTYARSLKDPSNPTIPIIAMVVAYPLVGVTWGNAHNDLWEGFKRVSIAYGGALGLAVVGATLAALHDRPTRPTQPGLTTDMDHLIVEGISS